MPVQYIQGGPENCAMTHFVMDYWVLWLNILGPKRISFIGRLICSGLELILEILSKLKMSKVMNITENNKWTQRLFICHTIQVCPLLPPQTGFMHCFEFWFQIRGVRSRFTRGFDYLGNKLGGSTCPFHFLSAFITVAVR